MQMANNIETEIRSALDARANDVDVPDGLAERTLAFAREQGPQPLWGRVKGWRDARRMHARPSGYPRVLYVAGAVGTAVLLFAMGTLVTTTQDGHQVVQSRSGVEPSELRDESAAQARRDEKGKVLMDLPALSGPAEDDADASAGQVGGVVSSGDASVDSSQRDVDVETGDAEADDSFAFVGPGGDVNRAVTGDQITGGSVARGPFLDPKLVRAADIRVAVEDFDPAWDAANDVAAKHGGAVINSRTQQVRDEIAQGTVTMRVPSAKLDQVLDDLRSLGTLAQLNTTGDDIAEQINQNKQKIEDVRAEERELLDMQQRARSVSEQLAVKARLDDVRKTIESLRKKQRTYDDQVEFSAVSATIFEDDSVADDGSILARALDTGISAALTIMAGTLVIIAGLLPLALLAVAIWFGVRALRRRRTPTS